MNALTQRRLLALLCLSVGTGCCPNRPYFGNIDHEELSSFCSGVCQRTLEGSISLQSATAEDLRGLSCLTEVADDLFLTDNRSLTNLEGLSGLTYIGDDLYIDHNSKLSSLEGLNALTYVGETIHITDNRELSSLSGLDSLTTLDGQLNIWDNPKLTSLEGLDPLVEVGAMEITSPGWGH